MGWGEGDNLQPPLCGLPPSLASPPPGVAAFLPPRLVLRVLLGGRRHPPARPNLPPSSPSAFSQPDSGTFQHAGTLPC